MIPKKLFGAKVDKELEFDSQLPEYCPDIARLVKVDCTPFAERCVVEDGKATVNGRAVYDILYETDYKSRLRCCSFTQEFNHTVALPRSTASDISAFCSMVCERISCKLLSPRKVLLKATLGSIFDIEGDVAVKAVTVNEDGKCFFRKKTIGFEGRTALLGGEYRFGEPFALNQGEKNVGEIICGSVTLQEPQVSLSPGKAEIKSNAVIHMLCEEEENEGKYFMSLKTLPINIEFKNDAIEDFKRISVELESTEKEFSPELDQYGESRIIKAAFGVNLKLKINEPKAYTVAEDMFEKGFDSHLVIGKAAIPGIHFETDKNFSAETKIPPTVPRIEEIIDSSAAASSSSAEKTEGGINLKGGFTVTLLANSAEGIFSNDYQVPFEQFIPAEFPEGESEISHSVYPIEVIATLHSDGSVTAKVIAGARVEIRKETEESFISEVTKRIESSPAAAPNELVYFFPQENESLWNIAKHYRADPLTITETNPNIFDDNGLVADSSKPILIKC